jgi:hypothetical protein
MVEEADRKEDWLRVASVFEMVDACFKKPKREKRRSLDPFATQDKNS